MRWRHQGSPVPPPPEFKHATVLDYAKRFGLNVLVETGTFQGDMIDSTEEAFTDIYSIELSPELYNVCRKRFVGMSKIHLLLGDSAAMLNDVLSLITQPPLFWLDAHYSGGVTARGRVPTPILEELDNILGFRRDAVVLIDDARLFGTDDSYPTLDVLSKKVRAKAPSWVMEVKDDIIRLHERPSTLL